MIQIKKIKYLRQPFFTKCMICGYPFKGGSYYLSNDGEPLGSVCDECLKSGKKEFEARLELHINNLTDEWLIISELLLNKVKY